MELYAGLDLHSRNTYISIMDKAFNRVFKKRVPKHLELILQTLYSFRNQIKGFVVESTYNWYWLIDGLMDEGYSSDHLTNPSAISSMKD
jgi:transposase